MQIVHRDVPGNQSGAEIHRDDNAAVPDLTAPHLLFGEQVAEKGRRTNSQKGPDNRPVDRYERRMAQPADPQYL
ncbi:hypothetical protein D3C75_781850 [compost metagenome]